MTNIIKKILKTFVDILTVAIFLVLILIIVAKVKMMFSDRDYFELFGYSVFTVATGSMEPAIKQNDVIVVKKSKEYNVNDIATFKGEKAFITHRIISIRGHELVTKGDANNAKDEIIKDTDVIGKVVKILPKGAVWQKVFTSPLTIVMIFATLILFDLAFSYKGNKNKKKLVLVDKIENIPLEEVSKKEDSPKMTNEEIVEIYKKTDMIKNGENVEFDKKEQEFLDYTVRLDLDELMKHIDDSMNGDNNA